MGKLFKCTNLRLQTDFTELECISKYKPESFDAMKDPQKIRNAALFILSPMEKEQRTRHIKNLMGHVSLTKASIWSALIFLINDVGCLTDMGIRVHRFQLRMLGLHAMSQEDPVHQSAMIKDLRDKLKDMTLLKNGFFEDLQNMTKRYNEQVQTSANLQKKALLDKSQNTANLNDRFNKLSEDLSSRHQVLSKENETLNLELQKMREDEFRRGSKLMDQMASIQDGFKNSQAAIERKLTERWDRYEKTESARQVRIAKEEPRSGYPDADMNLLEDPAIPNLAIYKINALSSNTRVENFDGPDIPNLLSNIQHRQGFKILSLSSSSFFRSYKIWARLTDKERDDLSLTPLLKIRHWNSSTTPKKNLNNLDGRMMTKRIVIKNNKLTLDQQLGVKNKICDQVKRNTGQKIEKIDSKVLQSDTIFTVTFMTQTDKARRHIYEMKLSDMLGNLFYNKIYIFSWWKNFTQGGPAGSEEGILRRFIRLVRQQ